MKILAIDSSSQVASTAVVSEEKLWAEYSVDFKKTHSQTLLPMIDAMTAQIELDLTELEGIAVAAGPGSFTGLRIGSATAKGLAQALNIPIISVPTIDAMAYTMWGCNTLICPMLDARRNQVYTGLYRFEAGEFVTVMPQCATTIVELVAELNDRQEPVVFSGDGVPVQLAYIKENLTAPFYIAPPHTARQKAGSVGALALYYLDKGIVKPEPAAMHKPEYLRLSQAERELAEKQAKQNSGSSL